MGQFTQTSASRSAPTLTFASMQFATFTLTGAAIDTALPDVVVPAVTAFVNFTIDRVEVLLKFRQIHNDAQAANKLDGNQNLQCKLGGGAWTNCLLITDDTLYVAAAGGDGPGDVVVGSTNIAAVIVGPATYNFQWDLCKADLANLVLRDVQVLVKFYFR